MNKFNYRVILSILQFLASVVGLTMSSCSENEKKDIRMLGEVSV